jgi:hypothetical protein
MDAQHDTCAQDDTARLYDTNGWPEIAGNPISKVGVFPYRGSQLSGRDDIDPDHIYFIYRPLVELQDVECLNSFKLIPFVDEHTMLGSGAGLTPAEEKGVHGVTGENVYIDEAGVLRANIKVFSQSLVDLIEQGKRELSCGYRCDFEWTSGTYDGVHYDGVQRNLRGNHLALVESGRCGPDVAVLDSNEETKMETGELSLKEAVKKVMEAMNHLAPLLGETEEEKVEETYDADKDSPAEVAKDDDTEEETAEDEKEDKKEDDMKEEKQAKAEDSALVTFKTVMKQVAARDSLAKDLSWHIGAFDHAEMTEIDVAKYGVKKLGIKTAAGAELHTLRGFLQGAAKKPAALAVVQDTADKAEPFFAKQIRGAK